MATRRRGSVVGFRAGCPHLLHRPSFLQFIQALFATLPHPMANVLLGTPREHLPQLGGACMRKWVFEPGLLCNYKHSHCTEKPQADIRVRARRQAAA